MAEISTESEGLSRLALAGLLLHQEDDTRAAETLLRAMLQTTGADRGFVVAKEGGQFLPKFEIAIECSADDDTARFSQSLVRAAIAENRPIYSSNPIDDPLLSHTESVIAAAGRAVLVVPLSSKNECFGALYLEHPHIGGFTPDARRFVLDVAELSGLVLHRASKHAALERRSRQLEHDLLERFDFEGIVTRDPGMLRVLKTVGQIASAKAPVLITGESGTGKELIARAVHVNGDRKNGPYVTVHCAALPSSMLESELFGHIRGSFTGADRDRLGRVASASGGTLFLDEIGELSLEVQAKLLRVVQFGEIQRVGSDKPETVDVRVVAATHRDLVGMVKAGTFREDLYYRLRVVDIALPPLRARRGDILLLARHFTRIFAKGVEGRFTRAAIDRMESYSWPGNVRELAHAIERASLLGGDGDIDVDALRFEQDHASFVAQQTFSRAFSSFTMSDLESAQEALEAHFLTGLVAKYPTLAEAATASGIALPKLMEMLEAHETQSERVPIRRATESAEGREPESSPSLKDQVFELERKRIVQALVDCNWNQTAAALKLGMARRTLLTRLATYKIRKPAKKA